MYQWNRSFTFSQYWSSALRLCIELGWGHWDACVGTWELGTRDKGLGDIKYGTGGCVGQGQGTLNTGTWGMWMIIAKVGGICNISHFPYEYVLVNAAHPTLLMVPIFQQGDLDIGFTFFNAGGLHHVMEDFHGKVIPHLSRLWLKS